MAEELYRNPAWCLELLNLTGVPSAPSSRSSNKAATRAVSYRDAQREAVATNRPTRHTRMLFSGKNSP